MSIHARTTPSEANADITAVFDHAFRGKPLDPEVAKRVHERAAAIRARLPETNIAVDLIRESREEI